MQKIVQISLLLTLVGIFTGCAGFTSPARQHQLEEGKTYWFDYRADRRGAIFIPKHEIKKVAICSEPSPDVALQIVDKFRADVGTGKVTVGAEADVEEKVIQLAKRTQTIMFLRESLYRLCELSLNYKMDDEDIKKLYEKVIDAAIEMAKAEVLNAEQSKIEAEEKLIKTMKETPEFIDIFKGKIKKEDK